MVKNVLKKDKINYIRNRVMNGHAPHKLMELEHKRCMDKKDIFDIDKIKWKGLDK